jgi:hypothetical protein
MNRVTKDIFQYTLAGIVIIGFFILLYALIKSEIPGNNRELLSLVIGALIGSFSTIIGYFFGSSAGSSKKDEIIKDIQNK